MIWEQPGSLSSLVRIVAWYKCDITKYGSVSEQQGLHSCGGKKQNKQPNIKKILLHYSRKHWNVLQLKFYRTYSMLIVVKKQWRSDNWGNVSSSIRKNCSGSVLVLEFQLCRGKQCHMLFTAVGFKCVLVASFQRTVLKNSFPECRIA